MPFVPAGVLQSSRGRDSPATSIEWPSCWGGAGSEKGREGRVFVWGHNRHFIEPKLQQLILVSQKCPCHDPGTPMCHLMLARAGFADVINFTNPETGRRGSGLSITQPGQCRTEVAAQGCGGSRRGDDRGQVLPSARLCPASGP